MGWPARFSHCSAGRGAAKSGSPAPVGWASTVTQLFADRHGPCRSAIPLHALVSLVQYLAVNGRSVCSLSNEFLAGNTLEGLDIYVSVWKAGIE